MYAYDNSFHILISMIDFDACNNLNALILKINTLSSIYHAMDEMIYFKIQHNILSLPISIL